MVSNSDHFRRGVIFIEGTYQDNKMNGKVGMADNIIHTCFCNLQILIRFEDGAWLEGYFKDGVLHGFCRFFDSKDRLTFLGMHRNGKPFGTCWKVRLRRMDLSDQEPEAEFPY